MKNLKINYNDTFAIKHSRDYYRGSSFHYSGKWTLGTHYISDDYNVDFVVHDQVLLACAKSHLSSLENEPIEYIRDDRGTITGVVSKYWDFVLSGIVGNTVGVKIVDNYWYICSDANQSEDEQVWINTGIKAKFEFSDLTEEDIFILQQPGIDIASNFVENVIVQSTGSNTDRVISQKVVTDELVAVSNAKINRVQNAIEGNVASWDNSGNTIDSNLAITDITKHDEITLATTEDINQILAILH